MSRVSLVFAVFGLLLCVGCEKAKPKVWEIVAENQTAAPIDVSVKLGGSPIFTEAKVEKLEPGKQHVLLSAAPRIIVETASYVKNKQDIVLPSNTEVPIGMRFLIVVDAEGKITGTLVEMK